MSTVREDQLGGERATMSVSTRVDDLEILESPAAHDLADHIGIVPEPSSTAAPTPEKLLPVLAIEAAGLVAILILAFFLTSGAI